MDALHQARRHGLAADDDAWSLEQKLMEFLEGAWDKPDEGIWEVRGPRRHFTHSKVLAWVAFDRAIEAVESFDLPGPVDRWRRIRARDPRRGLPRGLRRRAELVHAELRLDGARRVDAADPARRLPAARRPARRRHGRRDPARPDARRLRRCATRRRGQRRRRAHRRRGRVPAVLVLARRRAARCWAASDEARELFERLLAIRNDLGLLSEEYDPHAKRLLGNFPQAFTHVGLVNSAYNLSHQRPMRHEPAPTPTRRRTLSAARGIRRPCASRPADTTFTEVSQSAARGTTCADPSAQFGCDPCHESCAPAPTCRHGFDAG